MYHFLILKEINEDSSFLSEIIEKSFSNIKNEYDIKICQGYEELLKLDLDDYNIVFINDISKSYKGRNNIIKFLKTNKRITIVYVIGNEQIGFLGRTNSILPILDNRKEISDVFNKILDIKIDYGEQIIFFYEDRLINLLLDDIYYAQLESHMLNIYATNNRIYSVRYTLKNFKNDIKSSSFFQCNSGTLVNLNHIKQIIFNKNIVTLNNNTNLYISRNFKKDLSNLMKTHI